MAGDVDLGGLAVQVVAGTVHSCALLEAGQVRCWGRNRVGQLGYAHKRDIGDDETPSSAGDVDIGAPAVQLSTTASHTCALLVGGAVVCWGDGDTGRLGYGNTRDIGDDETPALAGPVSLGGTALRVSAGQGHTCALLSAGQAICWGNCDSYQLGYGKSGFLNDIGDDETPVSAGLVDSGGVLVDIEAGLNHTCALLATGAARCWGSGRQGLLGYGNTLSSSEGQVPASFGDLELGGAVIQLEVGRAHSCALRRDGRVLCWGDNMLGQLGYGHTETIGDNETPASAGGVEL